ARDCERLLAEHVDPSFKRRKRLLRVESVRRADVEHVRALRIEHCAEVVLAPPDADELDPQLRERTRVDAADEPPSDDRRPHKAARNIRVRTSMSSRACSGGVR